MEPSFWRIVLGLVGLTVVFGAIALLSAYFLRRATEAFRLSPRVRRGLGAIIAVAAVALPADRYFDQQLDPALGEMIGSAASVVLLTVMIAVVWMFAVDVLSVAFSQIARWLRPSEQPERADASASSPPVEAGLDDDGGPDETHPLSLSRREVIRRVALASTVAVGGGAALYGTAFGRFDYEVTEVPIPMPGLPPALDGLRVVQLSDIHFGTYIREERLRAAVELVRGARPDLVVLTGDLVDHDPAYAPYVGRLVRRLTELRPRFGVSVIPGNHDYYAGLDEVLSAAAGGGGNVLRNEGRVLEGKLALLGVDDVWAARTGFGVGPDLDAALATVPRDLPSLLLCHNPVFFPRARGRVTAQLSGHTHAGQVNLGIKPVEWVLPYVEGLYREEGSHLYVNRGFGTAGPPTRVNARPEVTVAILVST